MEKKQSALAIIFLIGMLIGEFIFLFWSMTLTSKLALGQMTQDQYKAEQPKFLAFCGLYAGGLIFAMVMVYVWMKVEDVLRQKDQVKMDSQKGPIELDDFNRYEYLIQSKPGGTKEIKSTYDELKVIENSQTYQSILQAIESGVDVFKFDQSNFLKQQFEKDAAAIKAAEKAEQDEEKDKKSKKGLELPIDAKEVELIIAQLFNIDQFNLIKSAGLHFYYRPIESIKRIDDLKMDLDDDDAMKKDRLAKTSGILYLLPNEEKDYSPFRDRRHPTENDLELRLSYIDWRLVAFPRPNTPLMIDRKLFVSLKTSDKTGKDAKLKAFSYLTHLAVDRDEELRGEIEDKKVDLISLNRQLDEKRDQELEKMIHNGELEKSWRTRFEYPKINGTVILFTLLSLALGIFAGSVFF
jgi:hypothetical protein